MNWPIRTIKNHLRMSLSAGVLCMSLAVVAAHAEDPPILPGNSKMANVAPTVICKNQTYALCAKAKCFVFNSLAYCECDILSGNSISAPFSYPVLPPDAAKQNICDLNAQGAGNGFMASTFSLPVGALKGGNMAVYTCPAGSVGAYAQCDGGICFNSTSSNAFPGFTKPLAEKEIICSCPITEASTAKEPFGYQIIGPYPCQKKVFEQCGPAANELNGTTIPVGAPTGSARFLSIKLYGKNPDLNECFP
jgi:hypothetical protein